MRQHYFILRTLGVPAYRAFHGMRLLSRHRPRCPLTLRELQWFARSLTHCTDSEFTLVRQSS